jgi:outer membrane protein OmpA-like peptidoglycan-associated protein
MSLTPLTGNSGTIYDTQYFANIRDNSSNPLVSDSLNSSTPGRYIYTFTSSIHPFLASAASNPLDVTASSVAGSSSTLDTSWSAPANLGGANVINYTVNYRPSETTGQWSTQTTSGTSLRISGLTSRTHYDIFVTANNGVADSPASETVFAQTNPSTNADLQSLSAMGPSSVTLTPAFDPAVVSYTSEVENSDSSICLTYTTSDASAAVIGKKGGSTIASCNADLQVGTNSLTFDVTAQDGVITKTYTWVITRDAAVVPSPSASPSASPSPNTLTKSVSKSSIDNTIRFSTSSRVLTLAIKNTIKKSVKISGKNATYVVTGVAGFLPGVTELQVKKLALLRANIVKGYLVKLGVNKTQISVVINTTNRGIVPKTKIMAKYLTS